MERANGDLLLMTDRPRGETKTGHHTVYCANLYYNCYIIHLLPSFVGGAHTVRRIFSFGIWN